MKVVWVVLCVLLVGAAAGLAAHVAPGDTSRAAESGRTERTGPGGFVQGWGMPVWRDEFDGGSVDTAKWNVRDHDHVAYDVASLYRRQVTVRDHMLVLRAQRIDPAADPFHRGWATGYVDTLGGKFSQRYGRFEISAELPTAPGRSRGLWPSFWLRDDRGPGEIDVMEAWGTPSSDPFELDPGSYTWTVHPDTDESGDQFSGSVRPQQPPSLSDGFHRYAVEWTPAGLRFLFDDRVVGEVRTSDHPWLRTSFPSAVNIRLQLAVGSDYAGLPNSRTRSPADYLVDYVRVWAYHGH